jgi:uncharacterized protein with FMN-binding domain
MNAETREPTRLPVRGTIGLVGTVGALALLLSFRGAPSLLPEAVVAVDDEAPASDELLAATATASSAAEAVVDEVAIEAAAGETMTTTGQAVAIRWGDVQVAVTVQGHDIIDVQTLAIPDGDRKSSRINANAEPILREEAIAGDTADVSVISGATYTSEAYAMSLQSALDQLGV